VEYRELGRTGVSVSVVSYGTAPLGNMFGVADEREALGCVGRALEAGITFIDTSPYYGEGLAEERLGRALKGVRDQVLVGTKAGRYGLDRFDFSPARIRASVEESLRRLGTDHVDILQLHDVEFVDLDEVFADSYLELARLRGEGKCRFIGMSGYPIATLRRAIEETDLDVVLSYAHSTLLHSCLQRDLLPLAHARGVGVINAAAVALGLLTPGGSKIGIDHPADAEIREAARRVVALCQARGVDVSFLANQYAIQRSQCPTTVVGTARPAHLDAAVAAATTPIDDGLLGEVLEVAAPVRDRCWTSGLPENN
jgi:L-galactose dehydrogenase